MFSKGDRMPMRRLSLSRAELGRHRSAAQRLRAGGLDIEIPEELQEHARTLDIHIAPSHENFIWQLPTGTVAYAIWVRLVALRPNVILEDSQIASAWDQDLFPLSVNEKGLYSLRGGFCFTQEEALNHRFEKPLCFHHRGDLVEGWLLATGLKPIPDAYRNNTSVPVDVSFTDQFGVDYVSQAYALMERSAHYKAPTLRTEKFSSLYALSTSCVGASIGENNVSMPACRTENTIPPGAPAARRRGDQALVEDLWG
jgi:hypothetical protein